METRNAKLIIGKAGGTAGKDSKTYKISIPSKWVNEIGLEHRNIELCFDGKSIILKPQESLSEFSGNKKLLGHQLVRVSVFDGGCLCSVICADLTDKTVKHEDFTDEKIAKTSSKGNQEKWYDGETNSWYKLDQFGYESLAETLISEILMESNIESGTPFTFVRYGMARLQVHGRKRAGCVSKNFLKDGESIITLNRLLTLYLG